MAERSTPDFDSQFDYRFATYPSCYQDKTMQPPPPPGAPPCNRPPPQAQPSTAHPINRGLHLQRYGHPAGFPRGDSPREIRNRAEKMRRDRLNQSVAQLAAIVPPVVAAGRKIDKTSVLRLTAHYLRAHQYVFGDSIGLSGQRFSPASMMKVLSMLNGFLITVTYRGLIVVVSQNVHQYLGYNEVDLLGHNLLNITHEDDRAMLKDQLMPKTQHLGPNGELLIPNEPGANYRVGETLAQEKRQFIIRLKKHGQRSDPIQYVTCHVEGSLRKSDKACSSSNRSKIVRRARARTENPYSSGNDIVFIGMIRPSSETFINESALEGYHMQYRTRHSIDGQIIQCEARIALVTGYMTHEVSGVNAMNFMHRDDVRWVAIALREMYDQHKIYGESCYRLIIKNGQFIYMRTRGRLDVDKDSRACTSFVCTNTVVEEKEGKRLIKAMRKKFSMIVNNQTNPAIEGIDDEIKDNDNDDQSGAVENPRRLEEVILHLVNNLPSTPTDELDGNTRSSTTEDTISPDQRITIIPPDKKNIVNAIDKIYGVIKNLDKDQDLSAVTKSNDSKQSNQRSIRSILDEQEASSSQEKRVIELGPNASNDPNEIFKFGLEPNSETICHGYENNVNTESVVDSVLPDLGYFDSSLGGYASMSSIFGDFNQSIGNTYSHQNEYYRDQNEYQTKFHVTDPQMNFFPLAKVPEESSLIRKLSEPCTSTFMSGIKRPNNVEHEDFAYKSKKVSEVVTQSEPISELESPTLESIFDEPIFDYPVENEVGSLDSVDPELANILATTTSLQNILGQLGGEQQDDELPDLE